MFLIVFSLFASVALAQMSELKPGGPPKYLCIRARGHRIKSKTATLVRSHLTNGSGRLRDESHIRARYYGTLWIHNKKEV